MIHKLKFKEWDCILNIGKYPNGALALYLTDEHDGDNIATCTVNIPEFDLKSPVVAIKEYSENKGMTKALIDAGIIKPKGMKTTIGNFGSEVFISEVIIDLETLTTE